jgi:hypothetical protein
MFLYFDSVKQLLDSRYCQAKESALDNLHSSSGICGANE